MEASWIIKSSLVNAWIGRGPSLGGSIHGLAQLRTKCLIVDTNSSYPFWGPRDGDQSSDKVGLKNSSRSTNKYSKPAMHHCYDMKTFFGRKKKRSRASSLGFASFLKGGGREKMIRRAA